MYVVGCGRSKRETSVRILAGGTHGGIKVKKIRGLEAASSVARRVIQQPSTTYTAANSVSRVEFIRRMVHIVEVSRKLCVCVPCARPHPPSTRDSLPGVCSIMPNVECQRTGEMSNTWYDIGMLGFVRNV